MVRRALVYLLLIVGVLAASPAVAYGQPALTSDQGKLDTPSTATGQAGHTSTVGPNSGNVSAAPSGGSTLTAPQQSLVSRALRAALYESVVRPALFDYGVVRGLYHMVKGTVVLLWDLSKVAAKLQLDYDGSYHRQLAAETWAVVSHPVALAKGIGHGIALMAKSGWNTALHGSPQDQGELAFNVVSTVAPVVGWVGKIGAAEKVVQGAAVVEDAINAEKLASGASELGQVAKGAELAGQADETIKAAATGEALEGRAAEMMGACFAAGTLVESEDGPRRIETIHPGDRVLSRDPQSGALDYRPVVRTFITPDRPLERITVNGETIEVTPNHPFWVEGRGWTPAAELSADAVLEDPSGAALQFSTGFSLAGSETVYNLEVEGFHTYFVGKAHVWVHNACSANLADAPVGLTSGGARFARFPGRQSIEYAMGSYLRDPAGARAQPPLSLAEFFGSQPESMNKDKLAIELLKPRPESQSGQPIAFLRTYFYGGDSYWNDRYKDVQLFRLVESTGTAANPFPEAAHIGSQGSALVRIWTDYRPLSKGIPAGLAETQVRQELARVATWAYVSGNMDGPASNLSNAGFALFKDASGKTYWRGVLIDAGAAWHPPPPSAQPWNMNLLGRGPVVAKDLDQDLIESLRSIARATPEELAKRSQFAQTDQGALTIVTDQQARARQVLTNYGISW